jgi:hypothetical protein
MSNTGRWSNYSNEDLDFKQHKALALADKARAEGRPAPPHGYASEHWEEATTMWNRGDKWSDPV